MGRDKATGSKDCTPKQQRSLALNASLRLASADCVTSEIVLRPTTPDLLTSRCGSPRTHLHRGGSQSSPYIRSHPLDGRQADKLLCLARAFPPHLFQRHLLEAKSKLPKVTPKENTSAVLCNLGLLPARKLAVRDVVLV